MSPERWHRVETILAGALNREAAGRAAFLQEACGDDESLRQEVESLLAHEGEGGQALASVVAGAAALFQGRELGVSEDDRIGVYRVVREIGRGGMGEVWLAEDTRLGRPVAIKFLTPGRDASDKRFQRFQEEARAASALNHPNIVTIYDTGEDRGGTTSSPSTSKAKRCGNSWSPDHWNRGKPSGC